MNVTFKLKNSVAYASLIGIPINTWRLYFGLAPWTGTNQSEWSTTPYGPVPVDQPLTAYMGDQRYIMVMYNEGQSAHGQMAFVPQDFFVGTVYYLNMLANTIESGEPIPPDTDANNPPPGTPPPGPGFSMAPLLVVGIVLGGLVLLSKEK